MTQPTQPTLRCVDPKPVHVTLKSGKKFCRRARTSKKMPKESALARKRDNLMKLKATRSARIASRKLTNQRKVEYEKRKQESAKSAPATK